MNKIICRIVFVCVSLLFSSCGDPAPPDTSLVKSSKKAVTQNQPSAATDNLVVYLDTSASMAGYISPNGKTAFSAAPDGQTVFSKMLLELRNVVTTMSPQPQIVVRKVDSQISAPSYSDLDLSQASINRGLYTGKETNLAGAIKIFSQSLDENAEQKIPPRFHILVTDGVQSSKANNTDLSCAQGSDSICVKKQLLELINSGWGGSILGMKSEFQGNVYSEIENKTVVYNSGKDAAKFRPFYLYIFSPDRESLNNLTESLKQRFAPLGKPEILREYALTADYANKQAVAEIVPGFNHELLEVSSENIKDGENPVLTVKSSLDTETKGAQQFVLKIKPDWSSAALSGGTPDELANLVKWDVRSVYPEIEDQGLRYPNFKLIKQEIKSGIVELTFETGWSLGAGNWDWRMYQVTGLLDVTKSTPPWVNSWTTNMDTTPEAANKTLNIESSLANLWKNNVLESYPVAEITIRVGCY